MGVDRVLADLRRTAVGNPTSAAMLAVASGQAHNLRHPTCSRPAGLFEDNLADDLHSHLQSRPCLVALWTTCQVNASTYCGHQDCHAQVMLPLACGGRPRVLGSSMLAI